MPKPPMLYDASLPIDAASSARQLFSYDAKNLSSSKLYHTG